MSRLELDLEEPLDPDELVALPLRCGVEISLAHAERVRKLGLAV